MFKPRLHAVYCFILCQALASLSAQAALNITPAVPVMEAGGEIRLSAEGAVEPVAWTAAKGQINGSFQGMGAAVTYTAPAEAGIVAITVQDAINQIGTLTVTVLPVGDMAKLYTPENARWGVHLVRRNRINALLLSADGVALWAGTNNGLEKRDPVTGRLQRVYTKLDGLPANFVRVLIGDGAGGLWAGTDNGLARQSADGIWTVYDQSNSGLPDNSVRSLADDGAGRLWAGTRDGGLARLDADGAWTVYNRDNSGLLDNFVYSLAVDGAGGLWAGTDSGLSRLGADGAWTNDHDLPAHFVQGLASDGVGRVWADGAGGVWASTWNGLTRLGADGTRTVYNYINYVYSLAIDDAGRLWAGTSYGLLWQDAYGNGGIYALSHSGLPDDWILSIANDGTGGVWAGTREGGLARMSADGIWTAYDYGTSGLPGNTAWSLIDDGAGGLWAGADGVLARRDADGAWTTYDQSNTGLPDESVSSLVSDGTGGMWAGTLGGGLAQLGADGIWTLYHAGQNWNARTHQYDIPANSGLPNNHVQSLAIDGVGGLWAGGDGGLARLSADGIWTAYNTDNSGLPSNSVPCLALDGAGGLWTGTNGGLARLGADGIWTVYSTDNSGLPNNDIRSLAVDGKGGLWASTHGSGIARLGADGAWTVYNTDNSGLPDNYVDSLVVDSKGELWAGTGSYRNDNGGLARLSADGTWTVYNKSNSALPDNRVENLALDDAGGLWVDTWYSDLVRLDADGIWTTYNKSNFDLPNNYVASLAVDDAGELWVGASGILARLDADEAWTVYGQPNTGLPDMPVQSLAVDGTGGLWASSWGGLARLDADGFWTMYHAGRSKYYGTREIPANSGLPDNDVRSLAVDGAGGLWAGTAQGGLVRLSADGTWTVYNKSNSGLPDNWVSSLAVDDAGGLWAGTNGGLARLDTDGIWTVYNIVNSGLPSNYIMSLAVDSTGRLWAGTRNGLAWQGADGAWTVYNQSNSGLPYNTVQHIVADDAGGLWVDSHDSGLARLSADGIWTVYNTANSGLLDNDVWSFAIDGTGGLWANTYNSGLTRLSFFDSEQLTLARQTGNSALLTDKRAAIVIHPQGSELTGRDTSSVAFMAAHAYRSMTARGYTHDEIYFLSAAPHMDIDGDGYLDPVTDAPVKLAEFRAGTPRRDLTLADLRAAFDWAALQGALDQPLLVIFTGYGETNRLLLDAHGTAITALELDALLDSYQENTGNPVVAILEAPHSGTFIPELSGDNRVIITSADSERAYYDDLGALSFTRLYFDKLRDMNKNRSFSKAFSEVSAEFSGADSIFRHQRPLLDDNGDGVANSLDGILADSLCLNGCIGSLSGMAGEMTLAPETPAQTVRGGQTVLLAARAVITGGYIRSVRAVVLTPEAEILRNAHGFSLIPPASVPLTRDPADPERWSGTFFGFAYNGSYVVKFLAEDRDGFLGPDASVTLTAEQGREVPIAPVPNLKTVRNGNILRINLPFTQGEDMYAGIALPDGTLYLLDDFNNFQQFDGSLPRWNGAGTLLEVSIAPWMPHGEYQLYMLRLPVGAEPWSNTDQWLTGVSSFTVE